MPYKVFQCIMSLQPQHYERKVTLYDKLIIQQKQTDFQIKSIFFNLFSELLLLFTGGVKTLVESNEI